MSSRGRRRRRLPMAALASRQSKAAIAVDVQSQHEALSNSIQLLRATAATILESEKPTKRARKELLDTADTLLSLQGVVLQEIPKLIPSNCTKYSINRLQSESNHAQKTNESSVLPRDNMRTRYYNICGHEIPLPKNKHQYCADEVCNILVDVQSIIDSMEIRTKKDISVNKAIDAMINYKSSPTQEMTSLIPATRSVMYRVFNRFKDTGEASWPIRGRRPILNNNSFLSSVKGFEKDKGRAISKKDMSKILKVAKEEVAKEKGNSTTMVVTPTKRSLNSYIALLPQLDPSRSKTDKVQQKREARYIVERSVCNAISHITTVALLHYQIGKQDKRLKKIESATEGAKLLYDLVKKENEGLELQVVMPMFISTTDDTTLFVFEGSVDSTEGEGFIICKDEDTGTRSSYTQTTSSTASLRGLRIRHTIPFNAYGNLASLYATVYVYPQKSYQLQRARPVCCQSP